MSCSGHFLFLSKCDDACSIIVCDVVTKERKIVRERKWRGDNHKIEKCVYQYEGFPIY